MQGILQLYRKELGFQAVKKYINVCVSNVTPVLLEQNDNCLFSHFKQSRYELTFLLVGVRPFVDMPWP